MSVVQFPSAPWDRPLWQDMISRSDSYRPVGVRLVGFWLCNGMPGSDDDHDPTGAVATMCVPGLAELSGSEQEFVRAGALAMVYQMNAEDDLRDHFDNWIREGAYV